MNDAAHRAIVETGAVAILRLREHGRAVAVGQALADGGLPVMELTIDRPDALEALRGTRAALPADAVVGAGTVRDPADVARVAEAGAAFCVSPHVDPAVIAATVAAGLEPLPGASSPTEVATALDAGARLVKLFPAGPLGPAYLHALLGPFAGTGFVPTGGIACGQVGDWLDAGAVAVGLGSDLVPPAPSEADVTRTRSRAQAVVEAVGRARGR